MKFSCMWLFLGTIFAGGCSGVTFQLEPTIRMVEDEEGNKITTYTGKYTFELDQPPSDIMEIAWNNMNELKELWNDEFKDGDIDEETYEAKIKEIRELAQHVAGKLGIRGGWGSGLTPKKRALVEATLIIEIFDRIDKIGTP